MQEDHYASHTAFNSSKVKSERHDRSRRRKYSKNGCKECKRRKIKVCDCNITSAAIPVLFTNYF